MKTRSVPLTWIVIKTTFKIWRTSLKGNCCRIRYFCSGFMKKNCRCRRSFSPISRCNSGNCCSFSLKFTKRLNMWQNRWVKTNNPNLSLIAGAEIHRRSADRSALRMLVVPIWATTYVRLKLDENNPQKTSMNNVYFSIKYMMIYEKIARKIFDSLKYVI